MVNLLSYWRPIVEIVILWFVFYMLLLLFKDTGAIQLLKGIIVLVIAFFVFQKLGLDKLNWVLTKLFAISLLAILIIFQPELRRGLTRIGQNRVFGIFLREEQLIEEIIKSVNSLSKNNIGAIIAIEREVGLRLYFESGISLDSKVTSELINAIFMPNSPLHDGGIIIEGGRIVAAGCLFPLTQNPHISKTLGTRHRAAIGLTEETDAIVIVVSEETGTVSIAIGGKLTRHLDEDGLKRVLSELYKPLQKNKWVISDLFRGK